MSLRRITACLLAAAVLAVAGLSHAQDWRPPMQLPGTTARPMGDANTPRWAAEPLMPNSRARIERTLGGQADVVALDSGLYQGFRNGMVCEVQRDGAAVAQLIIVAAQENRSAALILGYRDAAVILVPGDSVRPAIL